MISLNTLTMGRNFLPIIRLWMEFSDLAGNNCQFFYFEQNKCEYDHLSKKCYIKQYYTSPRNTAREVSDVRKMKQMVAKRSGIVGPLDGFISKLVTKQQHFSMRILHFAGEEIF